MNKKQLREKYERTKDETKKLWGSPTGDEVLLSDDEPDELFFKLKKARKPHKTQKFQLWLRVQDKFIDLPGSSRISILPDIQAFDETIHDEAINVSRWESEGGKT